MFNDIIIPIRKAAEFFLGIFSKAELRALYKRAKDKEVTMPIISVTKGLYSARIEYKQTDGGCKIIEASVKDNSGKTYAAIRNRTMSAPCVQSSFDGVFTILLQQCQEHAADFTGCEKALDALTRRVITEL